MKRFIRVLMLVCLMAALFTVSAYADYDVNGQVFTDWTDAKAYANTITSGNITITFDGTVELTKADVETDGVIFATDGAVFFVGNGGAVVHIAPEYNHYTFNQPGGLYFSNLTLQDDSWADGGSSASSQGDRGYRYFDVNGTVGFNGVYFPGDCGVQTEGGSATFTGCTFESTANEYGLWVAAGNVAVYGGSFNGNRAIKVCDEYCKGSRIDLSVSGATFNQSNKAAVETDIYSDNHQINLSDNTYGGNGKIINLESEASNISITPDPIGVSPAKADIASKATVQLSANSEAILSYDNPVALVWSSSDASVATVDANGLVTGIKRGTVTITATAEGTTVSSSAVITVDGGAVVTSVPATADNSNMTLWSLLFVAFAAVAVLTAKKRKA